MTNKKPTPKTTRAAKASTTPSTSTYVSEAAIFASEVKAKREDALTLRSQLVAECEAEQARADAEIAARQARINDLDLTIARADAFLDVPVPNVTPAPQHGMTQRDNILKLASDGRVEDGQKAQTPEHLMVREMPNVK